MLSNDFLERMKTYLGDDYESFIDSYNDDPIRALRINKIKEEDFLSAFNYNVTKMNLKEDCFYLNTLEKVGRNPLHHAGAIYLQDPSAMIPAYSYDFENGIKILDLCAAPGGKTGQLCSLNPDGLVVSNEINKARSKILFSNIERLGFKNSIITNCSSLELANKLEGFFDLILVDAPCSGEGMFRKDIKAVEEWNKDLVILNSNRQKEILDNANRMLKQNGVLIYSTCTFSIEENEENVEYLVDKYNYEILKPNDEVVNLTTYYKNEYCRRSYPFLNKGEGQFVACLKKNSIQEENYFINNYKVKKDKEIEEFIHNNINGNIDYKLINDTYYYVRDNVDLKGLNVVSYGVILGQTVKGRFIPHHNFFKAFGDLFKTKVDLEMSSPLVNKYLRGEELFIDDIKGFGVVRLYGVILGGFKASNGVLKNYYPKGLRNF